MYHRFWLSSRKDRDFSYRKKWFPKILCFSNTNLLYFCALILNLVLRKKKPVWDGGCDEGQFIYTQYFLWKNVILVQLQF